MTKQTPFISMQILKSMTEFALKLSGGSRTQRDQANLLMSAAENLGRNDVLGAVKILIVLFKNISREDILANFEYYKNLWSFLSPVLNQLSLWKDRGIIAGLDLSEQDLVDHLMEINRFMKKALDQEQGQLPPEYIAAPGNDAEADSSIDDAKNARFLASDVKQGALDQKGPYEDLKSEILAKHDEVAKSGSLSSVVITIFNLLYKAIANFSIAELYLTLIYDDNLEFYSYSLRANNVAFAALLEAQTLLSNLKASEEGYEETIFYIQKVSAAAFTANNSYDSSLLPATTSTYTHLPYSSFISGNYKVVSAGLFSLYTGDNTLPQVALTSELSDYLLLIDSDSSEDVYSLFDDFVSFFTEESYSDALQTLEAIAKELVDTSSETIQAYLFVYSYALALLMSVCDSRSITSIEVTTFQSFFSSVYSLLLNLIEGESEINEIVESDRALSFLGGLYDSYQRFLNSFELTGFERADPVILQIYVNLIMAVVNSQRDLDRSLTRLSIVYSLLSDYNSNLNPNYLQLGEDLTNVISLIEAQIRQSQDFQDKYQFNLELILESHRLFNDQIGAVAGALAQLIEGEGSYSPIFLENYPIKAPTSTRIEIMDFINTQVTPRLNSTDDEATLEVLASLLTLLENTDSGNILEIISGLEDIIGSALDLYSTAYFGTLFVCIELAYNRFVYELRSLNTYMPYSSLLSSLSLLFFNLLIGRSSSASSILSSFESDDLFSNAPLAELSEDVFSISNSTVWESLNISDPSSILINSTAELTENIFASEGGWGIYDTTESAADTEAGIRDVWDNDLGLIDESTNSLYGFDETEEFEAITYTAGDPFGGNGLNDDSSNGVPNFEAFNVESLQDLYQAILESIEGNIYNEELAKWGYYRLLNAVSNMIRGFFDVAVLDLLLAINLILDLVNASEGSEELRNETVDLVKVIYSQLEQAPDYPEYYSKYSLSDTESDDREELSTQYDSLISWYEDQ